MLLGACGTEAAADAAIQPIYVSAGLAWEREERAMAARFLAAADSTAKSCRSRRSPSTCATCTRPTHWAIRGAPPALRHAGRGRLPRGPQHRPALEGRGLHGPRRHRGVLIGPLAGNPFPDATPEFFDAMARALSIGLAAPIAIEAPFAAMHKVGRDPAGACARRAVRADAVVHAAARRAALRPLQQVPGADRGVQRSGRDGSDEVCALTVLILIADC